MAQVCSILRGCEKNYLDIAKQFNLKDFYVTHSPELVLNVWLKELHNERKRYRFLSCQHSFLILETERD